MGAGARMAQPLIMRAEPIVAESLIVRGNAPMAAVAIVRAVALVAQSPVMRGVAPVAGPAVVRSEPAVAPIGAVRAVAIVISGGRRLGPRQQEIAGVFGRCLAGHVDRDIA